MNKNEVRNALLGFHAHMNDMTLEQAENEYLGVVQEKNWTNKLYMAVERYTHILMQSNEPKMSKFDADMERVLLQAREDTQQ